MTMIDVILVLVLLIAPFLSMRISVLCMSITCIVWAFRYAESESWVVAGILEIGRAHV